MQDKSNSEINDLLQRFFDGKCTESEKKKVFDWLAKNKNEKVLKEFIRADFEQETHKLDIFRDLKADQWESILRDLNLDENSSVHNVTYQGELRLWQKQWFKLVAVILPLIIVSVVFLKYYEGLNSTPNTKEEVALVEKNTDKGRKKTITLPDKSTVILNSSSSIRFAKHFNAQDERVIFLQGEAFFEVEKNGKPFIVKTEDHEVMVLGTSFKVSGYKDNNNVNVAVATGIVKVSKAGVYEEKLLKGQKVIYDKETNKHEALEIDNWDKEFAWKDGVLIIDNAAFEDVIKALSDWYGVEIINVNYTPDRKNYMGRYENESLESVLVGLSYASRFRYEWKEGKLYIYNKE
ncbi:MAG: hypothetical protein CMO01_33400 [Thalassobius sp.]|nr:hypothetical protein [Thalassovita sp.]